MEQSRRNTQITILSISIFIVFTSLIWYSTLNVVDQYKTREAVCIDYDMSVKRFGVDDATVYNYTDIRDIIYVKRRTMIPLIFSRDTISKSKWRTVMVKKE